MTNGSSLSTAEGVEVCVGNELRDSLSLLDVLFANQFDGEKSDPGFQERTEKVEKNFYRGAPPEWLNFYISEQAELDGIGSAFIKRDGYKKLVEQIEQKTKYCGISTVELFHQPGCGGTTMSMQVLWDLRKKLRCAVLTDSASDIAKVANEVVKIFKAGRRNDQNTVLLLVNDNKILEDLQHSIMMTVAKQKLNIRKPVVIFLSCVRNNVDRQRGHVVLKNKLSDNEKDKFDQKKEELRRRYQDECEQFHGFNIIQSNFSQDYIRKACSVFSKVQRAKKPLKMQLVAILSLLNAYVPGSYLLESQCLDFLRHEGLPLKDLMQPFSHLIVTFQQDVRSEKKVRMAHTMIAQCCTELLADAGVTRSDTAKNLLSNFCRDSVALFLLGFVKDMLTKREIKREEDPINGNDMKEEKENFSKLILHITNMERNGNHGKEGKNQSVSVLNQASKTFDRNPFFPQTLARFYYIELEDYNKAEIWAKEAKQRDTRNSFVADTLGQVYKNHLKKTVKPREILQLAKKAIEAFEHEEKLADDETGLDMKEHGNARVSSFYNSRGLFGYLQVCNILYDKLVNQNETWKGVLTKEVSMGSVLESLEDNKLFRFNNLIRSLRDGVERKCMFFKKYLNYSKPKMEKDDPEYISKEISDCYRKYVGDSTQINAADKSVEVLSFLVEKHTQSELNYISILSPSTDSETALVNSILAPLRQKMPLHKDPPELHLLALLLHWSDNEDKCADLIQLTQQLHSSYKDEYQNYFRSRYLLPLIFIGKGKERSRIVGRKFIENHGKPDWRYDWKEEEIFSNSEVQELLLRIDGEVRNYSVYTTVGGKEIEIEANQRNSLWKTRSVTFYLGFTIRGPVAFGIQNKTADTGKCNGTALTNIVKETKDNEGH